MGQPPGLALAFDHAGAYCTELNQNARVI
jgi:hypothetical protein